MHRFGLTLVLGGTLGMVAGSCTKDNGGGGSGTEGDDGDGTDDCPVGTLGCPCTGGGACDPGLECRSTICVDAGDASGDDGDSGGTGGGGTASTDGSDDTSGAASGSDDTTGSDNTTGSEGTGCQKMDLLFVIDNSGSMFDNQQNLIDSFPGFADLMMNTLEAEEFNVGVVTSDSYLDNEVGCTAIGSLVTKTYAATCSPYADGHRFMTQNDDLAQKFACAGLVGDLGSGDEQPLEAGTQAISPALNAPGACNEGFIRDDALLVLVIISDEDDGPEFPPSPGGSPGDPTSWFNSVIGVKGNIEENVVVASLLWGMPGNVCPPPESSEREGVRIRELTEMFTYNCIGDICAADYGPFFAQMISVIDDACANFTPP